MFVLHGSKLHYQKARCWEAQVELAADAIDEGIANLEPPEHAFDGCPFPRVLTSLRDRILDWEVAAAADLILTLLVSEGEMSLRSLVHAYLGCVEQSRLGSKQQVRHERYICAVIDSMHVHLLLAGTLSTAQDDVLLRMIPLPDGSRPWGHLRSLIDTTWLQWCFECITTKRVPGEASDSSVQQQLRRRMSRAPEPYCEDTSRHTDVQ